MAEVTKRMKPSVELYGATLFKVVEEKFPALITDDVKNSHINCSTNNININPFLKHITVENLHPLIDDVYH